MTRNLATLALASALAVTIGANSSLGASPENPADRLEQVFAQLLDSYNANRPEDVFIRFSPAAQEALPLSELRALYAEGLRDAEYGRIVGSSPLETPALVVGVSTIRFEGGRVATMTVVINELGQILGLEVDDED